MADYAHHPLAESTKGPDFPAPGKVTLSCLGWFIRLFRSTLHLAPDLRPIWLGRSYKELPTTQFTGSQGHINPSLYMQTTTPYRGITNKNDNKIADRVWWTHSQGAWTVPLGQGGQFVHPEGVNTSYGEGASWGRLGQQLKGFLYSSFKMYSGHVQQQGDFRADPEPAQRTTYHTEPLGKSLESPF